MADKLEIGVGIKSAPFHQSLDAMKRGVKEFKGELSGMFIGVMGPVALATAAVATFWKAIGKASEVEKLEAAFRTLLGSAKGAKDMMKELADLASSTPYEFPELADAARKLIAFGQSSDTVAETLRRIGDIASGVGAPISEMAELYGKMRVNGVLFANDLDQLTGRGIPVLAEFAKQLGVGEGQVRKLASEGKVTFPMLEQALISLTSEGGKFGGMMDKMSQTFEGKMSTLSDAWGELLRTFAQPLLPNLKDQADGATSILGELKTAAHIAGQSVKGFFGYLAGGVDITVTAVSEVWQFLKAFFSFLETGITATGQSLEALKNGDFAGIAKAWGEAGKKAFEDMEKAAVGFYTRMGEAKARLGGRFATGKEPAEGGAADAGAGGTAAPTASADDKATKEAEQREERIKRIAEAEKDAARDRLEGEQKINALIEERGRLMDIYNANPDSDEGIDALEKAQKIQREIEQEQKRHGEEQSRREKEIADAREEEREAQRDYEFGKMSEEEQIAELEKRKAAKDKEGKDKEATDPEGAAKARKDAIGIQKDIDSRKQALDEKAEQARKDAEEKAKDALKKGSDKLAELEEQKKDARKGQVATIKADSLQSVGGGGGSSMGTADPTLRIQEQQVKIQEAMLAVLRSMQETGEKPKITPSKSWE